MAEDGKNFITEKMGPLPIWGWGVLIGGIFIIFKGIPHLSSSSLSSVPTIGSSAGSNGSGSTGVISPTNTTNPILSWLANAQNTGSNLGLNPSDLQTALTDYLGNSPIPSSSKTLLSAILDTIGSAPGINSPTYYTPTPITTTPTPTPTPTPTSTPTPTPTPTPTYNPTSIGSNFLGDIQHQLAANLASGRAAFNGAENYFVDTISTGQGVLGLTNSGGVYAAGNNFNGTPLDTYGSLFSIGKASANAGVGGSISYNPTNNSYTINATSGHYTFGPGGIVG